MDDIKVLVVDDEEVVRLSYLRSLTSAHCNVKAVCDADEALRAMEQQRFDVVLTDLRMPGMDGMSLLKTIKQRWPESQVIVVTGYPSIETAKDAVRMGAYEYLAKPVGPEQMITAAHGAVMQKRWALHREQPVSHLNS